MIKTFRFDLKFLGCNLGTQIKFSFPKRQIFSKFKSLFMWLSLIKNLIGLGKSFIVFAIWTVFLELLSLPKTIKKAFTVDRWGSLRISRFFRKIFETNFARKALGANLAAAVIITSVTQTPIAAFEKPEALPENQAEEVAVLPEPEEIVTTETTFRSPVGGYVSQGYHWYHPAIDLAGNDNQIIYPITKGKVVAVEYSRWGYGNSVVVDHENGLSSRYAHLSYIKAESGQEVDKNTALGYVGSTGFSTGPHLHLEVVEHGRYLNPLAFFPEEH
jgi:murein DD-endopeptidase MepM/ murein hydrolase activator NlpD